MLPSLSSESIFLENPSLIVKQDEKNLNDSHTISSFSIEWNSNKHTENLSLPLVEANKDSVVLLKQESSLNEIFTGQKENTETVYYELISDSDALEDLDLFISNDQALNITIKKDSKD